MRLLQPFGLRNDSVGTVPKSHPVGRAIPAAVIHQLNLRDKAQCRVELPGGGRCGARRYTQVHHIRPYSLGGRHELANLVTICVGHHRALHEGVGRGWFKV